MAINTFKLEEYLTKYEFSAPYLLCCSDAESFSMAEILGLASSQDMALWDNLKLGYTEPHGSPLLREEIASGLYPGLRPENILCFAGAEEGIFASLHVICEPGDHVIALTPCYQSLFEIPKLKGSAVTCLPLREENEWRINLTKEVSMSDNTVKKAYELGSQARHLIDEAQNYVKDGTENVTDCIKHNPFMSVSVAFIAGVLFARLFKD